jgi:hypothetical protein
MGPALLLRQDIQVTDHLIKCMTIFWIQPTEMVLDLARSSFLPSIILNNMLFNELAVI